MINSNPSSSLGIYQYFTIYNYRNYIILVTLQNSDTQTHRFGYRFTSKTVFTALGMLFLLILSFQLSYRWTRVIHIISGFVWYAMLVFLVIVFLPVTKKLSENTIYEIVGVIVPRIFHTVTISGFFAVGVGWFNAIYLANGRLDYFYRDWRAIGFTIAIVAVTLMYCFHLFLESSEINVSSMVGKGELSPDSEEYLLLLKGLQITPRVGFVIITLAILMMFIHV